jgi:hypothetical protein
MFVGDHYGEQNLAQKQQFKIIYSTLFHGKGLAVGVDSYNWTVLHFTEGQDPLDSRKRWHFSSLPKMLLAAHSYFIKERIKRLDFQDIAEALEKSFQEIEKLGEELVKEIIRQVPYGSLPRFPCNHMLDDDKKREWP